MIKQWVCGEIDGRAVTEFEIVQGDVTLQVMEYGATVHRLLFQGVDCVAGYDSLEGYRNGNSFQGATIGRYANRIGNSTFSLDNREFHVHANDNGVNSLHGGTDGFYAKCFDGEVVDDHTVVFRLFSPHGEGGYPGNLHLSVTFSVEDNGVTITYCGLSDQDTIMNFTNHAYFTLGEASCVDTRLMIQAHAITPVDDLLIPTGQLMDVTDTPFDFRIEKPIGRDLADPHPQLQLAGGYDHNYVLGGGRNWKEGVIVARAPHTGIRMTCSTDLPGVQLYTSNVLDEPLGKEGRPLTRHAAFCLETQFFPDSPNKLNFPSCVVSAEEEFISVTRYEFDRL